jgi:hypothetical protein
MGKQKSHLYIHNQTNLIMCLGFLVQQQERTNSRVLLDKSLESLLSLNKRFQLDFPSPKERRVFSVRGDDPIRPIPHTGATAHAFFFCFSLYPSRESAQQALNSTGPLTFRDRLLCVY